MTDALRRILSVRGTRAAHPRRAGVRVAYYSPLPPERTGIAAYSALLLPALRQRLEVEVARRGAQAPRADVALYHVGNNPEAHSWIVEALLRRPGVVALHDFVLHHLVAGMTLARGDAEAYLRAMEREAGLAGRLLAYGVLDGRLPPLWESRPHDFPLAGGVLDAAAGLIVHSRHVERRAREAGYAGRVWRIPHPAWPVPAVEPPTLPGTPVIGCFGHVTPTKRIPQLLAAFTRLRRRHARALLLLVGPVAPRFDLAGQLARFGLERSEAVLREEYVDERRLWGLMAASDVCVNLRAPTMGETSGSVVRALSLGRPLVVSDVGWFSELPADVALKVPPDDHETDVLTAALELLAGDEAVRGAMADAARAYVEREHDLAAIADRYAAALELAAGGDAVAEAVLADVAQAAADVGIRAGDPEVGELASRVRELELAP
ncbi:MAG: glycosyltransferase family 4 protein [Actinomycetota bacterium]|nr:glycosyltransferase family 4 protein [Actinomycetota bacterium]